MSSSDLEVRQMVAHGAAWAKDIQNGCRPGAWLSLLGKAGVGKTRLARFLWHWSRRRFRWMACEYAEQEIFWPKFVSDLRSGHGFEQLRDMIRWPVLFLDDVFGERDGTGFSTEQLSTLLGSRVGAWTLITSNCLLDHIASIEPRIANRMVREPGNHVAVIEKAPSWQSQSQLAGMA